MVFRSPYCSTAAMAARKPSPYTGDESVSIWCKKNSPSRLVEAVPVPFLFSFSSSSFSQMCAITWHIPSSTSFSNGGNLPASHIPKQRQQWYIQPIHETVDVVACLPSRRIHACISSWARMEPVNNLHATCWLVSVRIVKDWAPLQVRRSNLVPGQTEENQNGRDLTMAGQFSSLRLRMKVTIFIWCTFVDLWYTPTLLSDK